jgi:hypothetical protein
MRCLNINNNSKKDVLQEKGAESRKREGIKVKKY